MVQCNRTKVIMKEMDAALKKNNRGQPILVEEDEATNDVSVEGVRGARASLWKVQGQQLKEGKVPCLSTFQLIDQLVSRSI